VVSFVFIFKHILTFHKCLDTNHNLWRPCGRPARHSTS
jgi:hypothetical protein